MEIKGYLNNLKILNNLKNFKNLKNLNNLKNKKEACAIKSTHLLIS